MGHMTLRCTGKVLALLKVSTPAISEASRRTGMPTWSGSRGASAYW